MTKLSLRKENLSLRAGDWVEVKSADEILATLDEQGRLEALPFMPEMLQYCGKKFRVFKSAHKTCDTINESKNRSMTAAVHLEGLRCDGAAHGGCQAKCLLFWKDAWLRPAGDRAPESDPGNAISLIPTNRVGVRNPCDLEALTRAATAASHNGDQTDVQYACQATELPLATKPMNWWQPKQYVKDVISGNVRVRSLFRYWTIATFNIAMRAYGRLVPVFFSYSSIRKFFAMPKTTVVRGTNGTQTEKAIASRTAEPCEATKASEECRVQAGPTVVSQRESLIRRIVHRTYRTGKQFNSHLHRYPYINGLASSKTPAQTLNLLPGEWVQVRSVEEIRPTINRERRNRGLKFDIEMVPYCGRTFRVLARIEKIINEKTGRMMYLPNPCIILEDVTCSGCFSQNRLFCPRSIYPYWREIWLKRVHWREADMENAMPARTVAPETMRLAREGLIEGTST